MKNLTLKITGLAIAASLCATVAPAVSTYAANMQSNTNTVQVLNVKATTYRWVQTRDGVGVNLRKGPGTNYGIITAIPEGTRVELLSANGSWCKVKYGSQIGYVSRSYLVDEYGDADGM